jgi:hypothetical protein
VQEDEESSVTNTHIAVMKEVVQIRAGQLRGEGVGYLKALTQIPNEMYAQLEEGKDTPIGHIQPHGAGIAASGVLLSRVPWKDVVKVLSEALQAILKGRTEKKAKLEAIREQVAPWIAEVYQGQISL